MSSIAQLVVGPHSSSSLIRTNSIFTVEEITVNNLNVTTALNFSGDLTVNSLSVTGDIGITGVINIDGNEVLSGDTLGTGVTISSLETVGILTDLTVTGDFIVDTTTFFVDASNNNVGINNISPNSLYVLDVSGDVNIDGGITISGDLNVLGGITSTVSVTATIEENFVKLAISNTADMVDTGVFNLYNDGTTKFAGYFRDATDGVFKFFSGTTEEPSTTIDTSSNGFEFASLLVNNIEATTMDISTTGTIQNLGVTNNLFVTNNVDITNNLIVNTNTLFVSASTNRVGINNATPSYELDVSGDINTTGIYRIDGTSVLTENTLGTGVTMSSLETVGTLTSLDVSGDFSVDTNIFFVNSTSDRVGINNVTPSYDLDVSGDINTTNIYRIDGLSVLTENTLGSGIINSSLTSVGNLTDLTIIGDLTVDSNTLIVDSTNNAVGIGITNPSENFHVNENFAGSSIQARFSNENTSGRSGIQLNNASNNFNIQQNGNEAIIENFGGNISYLAKDTGGHTFLTTDSNLTRLRIENDGDIGIGTGTPLFRLDVSGGDINIESTSVYRIGGVEVFSNTGITSLGNINFNSTSRIEEQGGNIYISTTDIRQFNFNTNGDMIVKNGNIGISITNPGIDLAIGTTGTGLNAESDNELAIYTSGSEAIRIDSDGLVGINNSNPLHQLDINGTINFTGQILQNGSQLVNGDSVWTQQGNGGFVTLGGAIGIGTTTPVAQLHVEGGNAIFSDSVGIGITTPVAQLHVEGGNAVFSDSVGIGISNPTAGLQVDTIHSEDFMTNSLKLPTNGGASFIRFGRPGTSTDELFTITKNVTRDVGGFGRDDNSTGAQSITFNIDGSLDLATEIIANTTTIPQIRLKILSGGNVGINNVSPNELLTVGNLIITSGTENEGVVAIQGSNGISGNFRSWILKVGALSSGTSDYDTHRLRILDGVNERMTIDDNGDVGIGTTNPLNKLDVSGDINISTGNDYLINSVSVLNTTTLGSSIVNSSLTSIGELSSLVVVGTTDVNPTFRSQNENTDVNLFLGTPFNSVAVNKTAIITEGIGSFSRSKLHFCLNNTSDNTTEVSLTDSKMTITKEGNVGIGITSPTEKLDVVGNITLSGNIVGNGTIRSSTTGQLLNSSFNDNVTIVNSVIDTASFETVISFSYTRVSSSSKIMATFSSHYLISGSSTDSFESNISFGGSVVQTNIQNFNGSVGGGTRSGILFPITGVYTNSSTGTISIDVNARRLSSDDTATIQVTDNTLIIQEIAN